MDRFDNPVWQSYYSIYMPEKESILEKLKKAKTTNERKKKNSIKQNYKLACPRL